jgi:cobyrinic acid a,c-diamide synthase
LIPFDTLKDAQLPPCDALFIGGGFPESFIDELAANTRLRGDIRKAIENGLPTYAECGGLMYLAQSISWQDKARSMVGVIPGDILMHAKPVGRGYVVIEPTSQHPWCRPTSADFCHPLHAHEFHYSEIRGLPADTRYAYAVKRGHGVDGQHDGILRHNLLASYTHLRGTAGCDWPARFVQFARHCSTLTRETAPCLP